MAKYVDKLAARISGSLSNFYQAESLWIILQQRPQHTTSSTLPGLDSLAQNRGLKTKLALGPGSLNREEK